MDFLVKYLIGYPGWNEKMDVQIRILNGAIRIFQPFKGKDLIIDAKKILDVNFDAKSKRSGTRAATGALIGGVLTGGIGMLAGAAIGAKAKDKSEINIFFDENGTERQILLQTKDKTNAIYNAIVEAISYANEHHVDETSTIQSFFAVKPELDTSPEGQAKLKAQKEKDNKEAAGGCAIIIAIALIIFFLIYFCN